VRFALQGPKKRREDLAPDRLRRPLPFNHRHEQHLLVVKVGDRQDPSLILSRLRLVLVEKAEAELPLHVTRRQRAEFPLRKRQLGGRVLQRNPQHPTSPRGGPRSGSPRGKEQGRQAVRGLLPVPSKANPSVRINQAAAEQIIKETAVEPGRLLQEVPGIVGVSFRGKGKQRLGVTPNGSWLFITLQEFSQFVAPPQVEQTGGQPVPREPLVPAIQPEHFPEAPGRFFPPVELAQRTGGLKQRLNIPICSANRP